MRRRSRRRRCILYLENYLHPTKTTTVKKIWAKLNETENEPEQKRIKRPNKINIETIETFNRIC